MSLTGKPTVVEPRAAASSDPVPSLRPTQSAIASIRERLRLIETEINGLSTRVAGTSGTTDIASLQQQIRALRTRIEALEGASPTQWHVNGSLVGANHRVDFRSTSGIVITGSIDAVEDRVVISFQPVLLMLIQRSGLILTGSEVSLSGPDLPMQIQRGHLALGARNVALTV